MNRYHIPSLEHACQIVKLLASSSERLSASDVARRFSIPRTTAIRILATLVEQGLLSRSGSTFGAGSELFRLGVLALESTHLNDLSGPVLRDLSHRTGETAQLAILAGEKSLILRVVDSPRPVRSVSRPGTLVALNFTATGKVFLAYVLRPQLREVAKAAELEAPTSNSLRDVADLDAECERIVRRGYAVDNEECHLGVRCLAAPVWNASGTVAAAIGITAPASTFTLRRIPEMAAHVVSAAEWLSRGLGARREAAARPRQTRHPEPRVDTEQLGPRRVAGAKKDGQRRQVSGGEG